MTTWHVWQVQLDDPSQCVQYACPEEGERPDGMPWDDSAPFPVRGQYMDLDYAGSVEGEPLTPFGLDYDTQSAIEDLAPADVPHQTTVMAHFQTYDRPAQDEPQGLTGDDLGTDLPSDSTPV